MPAYESLILGEKTAVVFDIGTAYTKCGFAGETGPRFIIPTSITLPTGEKKFLRSIKGSQAKRQFLVNLLHELYYRHLLVNPKDRRVVIIESVLSLTSFRTLLADLLFNHFEVPSLLFVPAHLACLFTLGISSAIVLDCGYTEAQVIPIFEGYTVLNAWQAGQLGSKQIHLNLRKLLTEQAKLVGASGVDDESCQLLCQESFLSENAIEDIKVRTCFVSTADRASKWSQWVNSDKATKAPEVCEETFIYPLDKQGLGLTLRIPTMLRELGVECLFTGDNDQVTLCTLILRAILLSPIDVRRTLAENIVLIGGTSMLPGLVARLLEELNHLLDLPEFCTLRALKGGFRFHNPPGELNYIAWLGGAIFGALESLPGRSLSRTVYMETGVIPDWTTYIDGESKENERADVTRQ